MTRLLLFVLVGALWGAPQPPSFRLPADAAPSRYQLEMTLDPAKDDFSGAITIDLKVRKATPVLWLNASKLEISKAWAEQGGSQQTARVLPGGEDFAGFEFPAPLTPGTAQLRIEFSGKVNVSDAAGVFLGKRNDDRYLFTQFESIDARRAFPCFDEPGYKVPWQLALHVPKDLVAVSNTPVEREEQDGAGKKVIFRETKPLPSYLVAFAVGPLEFVDGGVACRNKVPVRIVVPRGDASRAKYAAQATREILTKLEDYFGIPYPFEKADQLSIPLFFGGAMENPGLVTYDATIILAPPQGEDTLARQRGYASIAAHELAHQWFGDLVTMAWWNDTWLNESFATFMSQKLLSTWKPEWQTKADDQDSRTRIMGLDRLASARQINQPVTKKQEITDSFDSITYQKGGAVLAMFDYSMGAENFRAAVHFYLTRHAGGNGTAQDFLDALKEIGGPAVATSFTTFLNQSGVPEITMRLQCQTGSGPQVTLLQERLRPLGSTAPDTETWKVPVCIAYESGNRRARQCGNLYEKTSSMALATKSCPRWFLGNADEAGYYYTKYDSESLEKLIANRSQLSLAEQVGVLGELDVLWLAGKVLPSEILRLIPQLKDDSRRQISGAAVKLAAVRVDLLPEELRPKYTQFVEENFGARARKLGWVPKAGESEDDELLRPQLVPFVARDGEDAELISSARELTDKWLNTRATLPADTIESIFVIAARNGDAALRDRMLAAAEKEKDEFFLGALLSGIGSFRQKELIEDNLRLVLAGKFAMRLAAYPLLFRELDIPGLERIRLEFVKANYDALASSLPTGGGFYYAAFLPFVAGETCSAGEAAEVQEFFGPRVIKVNGGVRNLAEAVETIQLCDARKRIQQPDLVRFFRGL